MALVERVWAYWWMHVLVFTVDLVDWPRAVYHAALFSGKGAILVDGIIDI